MENNWYSQQQDNWYAPLQSTNSPEQKTAAKVSKRGRHKSRIIAITVIALVLAALIGTSLAFHTEKTVTYTDNGFSVEYEFPVIPGKDEDSNDSGEAGSDTEDSDDSEYPSDFNDFFSSYYTQTETSTAEYNIERAELPIDYEISSVEASGEKLSLEDLYTQCSESVVAITAYINDETGYYWGSGMIISPDGLILTNAHVIEGCDTATVTLNDDTVYDAVLVGADSISDIAVLKIEAEDLPTVTFGDSGSLAVGQEVCAIGNPLSESLRNTLTNGIISAIERGVSYNGRVMTLLQTNTAINEGNSGGPLFNMYGQVIGITNMKMMSSYSSIEGIGFAIPSSSVVSVVNLILKEGEVRGRTSIGITVGAIPDTVSEYYDIPTGLYITAVSEGSDAEAKGIQPGDILVKVNGTEVISTSDVSAIKDQLSVGDTMTLTIWRNGETFDVDVALMDTLDIYK